MRRSHLLSINFSLSVTLYIESLPYGLVLIVNETFLTLTTNLSPIVTAPTPESTITAYTQYFVTVTDNHQSETNLALSSIRYSTSCGTNNVAAENSLCCNPQFHLPSVSIPPLFQSRQGFYF